MITYIKTEHLFPHPDNPRKDLGDLSELADSIKSNGLMQNITVVPWTTEDTSEPLENQYKIVIGHRRCAAAKMAGLAELPCAISNMDKRTQLATMLLENMQRSDLTIYEQAHGFQLMLDMGDSVDDISKTTGFSKNTVRRRVRLLELDSEKFKESVERGVTLEDYAKLDKIEDSELKNSLVDKLGTSNFEYALRNAIDTEKWRIKKNTIIENLEEFADKVENMDDYMRVESYSSWRCAAIDLKKPSDTDSVKYFYFDSKDTVYLLKEDTGEASPVSAEQLERQRIRAIHDELDGISRRAYQMRSDFIRNFNATKKHSSNIAEFAVRTLMCSGYSSIDDEMFAEMLGLTLGEGEELSFNTVSDMFTATPERVLLVATYCNDGDNERWKY